MNEIDELKEERRLAREWMSDAKTVSIMAFSLSTIVLLFSFWALASYQEEITDFSPISFSLALLQTILALGAFCGFWMIRNVAISKAREVAEKEAKSAVDSHLEKNHEKEVLRALKLLFGSENGKQLLADAMSDPSVVATLVASAARMGLRSSLPAPDKPISNPGKQFGNGEENINELHSEFWDGIAERDKKRFLKPYEQPPFEE